jgi:hypothetical protein
MLKVQLKVMMVLHFALMISVSLQTRISIYMKLSKMEIYILKFPILQLLMLGQVQIRLSGLVILHTFMLANLIHQSILQLFNLIQLPLNSVFQVFAT